VKEGRDEGEAWKATLSKRTMSPGRRVRARHSMM
jgi:hypothetical protein